MAVQRRVVVVGSGAAGMSAAVAAASSGAHVTVLESADKLGGTTAWSGGGIWIPVNPHGTSGSPEEQRQAGLTYMEKVCIGDSDPELMKEYLEQGERILQASEANGGVRWHQIVEYPDYHAELEGGVLDGRSLEIYPAYVPPEVLARVRTNPYGSFYVTINEGHAGNVPDEEIARRERESLVPRGRGLVGAFAAKILERGGQILTSVRPQHLISSGGVVTGVEVDGQAFEGQVVIATGGFDRNQALVRSFLRGPMTGPGGVPTNLGDGLLMGMEQGAALANMSEAWWSPSLEMPGHFEEGAQFYRLLFNERCSAGSIVVDSNGRRYADEASNYNDFGRSMHEFDPSRFQYNRVPSWLVFDAECRSTHRLGGLMPDEPDPAWMERADSIEALAQRLGMEPATLRETVERFNRFAAAGVDEDYGRGAYAWDKASADRQSHASTLRPLTKAPFYALRMLVGCLGTKGGLKTNGRGQVLRADGAGVIPGLYAAGNAAANPFGHAYPGAGSTVGPALVFGWRAGETAALGD